MTQQDIEQAALLDAEDLGGDALVYFLTGFKRGATFAQGEWVSCAERLPEYGKYLCITTEWIMELFYDDEDNTWRNFYNNEKIVTHYRPLPSPPKSKE